jgi:hypothetical protein
VGCTSDIPGILWHNSSVSWEIEYTEEFEGWWNELSAESQDGIAPSVELLARFGPGLSFPHSSAIRSSRHDHMRELRIQHKGSPIRILYAFDPKRTAILLIGGDKTGKDRWYEIWVPLADKLYDRHLKIIDGEKQGEQDG